MCYNCGCGMTDDNMGKSDVKGASLTDQSLDQMADEWGMTVEETKKNIYEALKKELEKDKD